jgi:hypothetical protein
VCVGCSGLERPRQVRLLESGDCRQNWQEAGRSPVRSIRTALRRRLQIALQRHRDRVVLGFQIAPALWANTTSTSRRMSPVLGRQRNEGAHRPAIFNTRARHGESRTASTPTNP